MLMNLRMRALFVRQFFAGKSGQHTVGFGLPNIADIRIWHIGDMVSESGDD